MGLFDDDLAERPWRKQPEREPASDAASSAPITPLAGVRASRYAAKAFANEISTLLSTGEGRRNDQLNISAFSLGQFVGGGHLSEHDVTEQLRAAAHVIGLEPGETEGTIASGLGAGKKEPRVIEARDLEGFGEPNVTEVDASALLGRMLDQVAPTDEEEAAFWAARPLLAHVHTYARARMVAPWAVLGVTLARIIAATGYGMHIPPIIGGRASLNMFVGLVGRSGSGKGAATAVSLEAVKLPLEARSVRIASGEAITHVYKKRQSGNPVPVWTSDEHAALIEVSEIDRLAGQAGRQGSTIMADLRSAWSGELLGQIAADKSRSLPLEAHEYRLCLVAGIQPHRADCLLDDADGGTPQRFMWMPATDPDAPDVLPAAPEPITVTTFDHFTDGALSVCEKARQEIVETRRAQNRGEAEALDAHAMLARVKVAAALALADGRRSVLEEDWRLAGLIARKSAAVRADVVEALTRRKREANRARAEADAERSVIIEERTTEEVVRKAGRAILRRLHRAGDWVTAGHLKRPLSPRNRQVFGEAIEALLEAGAIEVRDYSGRGPTTTEYRAAE